jgi:hypothetical protein
LKVIGKIEEKVELDRKVKEGKGRGRSSEQ